MSDTQMLNHSILTLKDIATRLDVSRPTVTDLIRRGKLPAFRPVGSRRVYVRADDFQRFLEARNALRKCDDSPAKSCLLQAAKCIELGNHAEACRLMDEARVLMMKMEAEADKPVVIPTAEQAREVAKEHFRELGIELPTSEMGTNTSTTDAPSQSLSQEEIETANRIMERTIPGIIAQQRAGDDKWERAGVSDDEAHRESKDDVG